MWQYCTLPKTGAWPARATLRFPATAAAPPGPQVRWLEPAELLTPALPYPTLPGVMCRALKHAWHRHFLVTGSSSTKATCVSPATCPKGNKRPCPSGHGLVGNSNIKLGFIDLAPVS